MGFTMSVLFPCTPLVKITIIKILWEKQLSFIQTLEINCLSPTQKTLNSNSNPPIATNVSTSHKVYSQSEKANIDIFEDIVHQSAQTFNRRDIAFA